MFSAVFLSAFPRAKLYQNLLFRTIIVLSPKWYTFVEMGGVLTVFSSLHMEFIDGQFMKHNWLGERDRVVIPGEDLLDRQLNQ